MDLSQRDVVLGMSGGVDSAVAALLLRERGCRVTAVTLRLWPPGDADTNPAIADAAAVCAALGIEHRVLDGRALFRQKVIEPFADEYTAGRTPNPCVLCNRDVKFELLRRLADELGACHVATGHYAQIKEEAGAPLLCRANNTAKDQSYVLWVLPRATLARLLLPLGALSKEEARRLAAEANLPVARKADSQDICFVPDGDYTAFLERLRPGQNPPGFFVGGNETVLGPHKGLWHYTVGQRRGLGLSFARPVYVGAIDGMTGNITLTDDAGLRRLSLTAQHLNWHDRARLEAPEAFDVKLRYAAPPVPALVTPLGGGRAHVALKTPQRAVTPGQSAVFYRGETLCGGGIICQSH